MQISRTNIFYVLLLLLALLAPWVGVYPIFLMTIICYAIFACAFNLMLGYSGMLSFGHAAYFGVSSYVTAWLLTANAWSTAGALLVGALASTLLGLLIGLIAIRRSGIYFAMITLALAQLVYFVCLQAPFTGGENGIQGVPRGDLFGLISLTDDLSMYYFVVIVFVLIFLLIQRIVHSPFGQILKAIRENEPRAESLGYFADHQKLLVFVLSSTLAGLAGSLKTLVLGFATLSDVLQSTSGEVILMTMLGGAGTFFGPVLGSAIVVALQNLLSDRVGSWVTVIIGAIFVICVMAFRRGIVGEWLAYQDRKRSTSAT
jgi:branched-chain amino acid transport system permease protein